MLKHPSDPRNLLFSSFPFSLDSADKMDLFVANVPIRASDQGLRDFLRPHLSSCGIKDFILSRLRNNKSAILTVLDTTQGLAFLTEFGSTLQNSYGCTPKTPLRYQGRALFIRPGNKQADVLALRTLEKETKDRAAARRPVRQTAVEHNPEEKALPFVSLSCGQWDYHAGELRFGAQLTINGPGTLRFGGRVLILESEFQIQNSAGIISKQYRVHFGYSTVQSIAIGHMPTPSITLTFSEAPRMYRKVMSLLSILGDSSGPQQASWQRVGGLSDEHKMTAGSCLAYRIELTYDSMLQKARRICHGTSKLPQYVPLFATSQQSQNFSLQVGELNAYIRTSCREFGYAVYFQIQRLVQNGYLTPKQTLALIPTIKDIARNSDSDVCAGAIRKMARQIPFAGGENTSEDFTPNRLAELLREGVRQCKQDGFYSHAALKRHSHIRLIHRAIITPAGVYLEGPEPETINRVIRRFPEAADHFLRVEFGDEDFERLRFERGASLHHVIHKDFKHILDRGLHVADRRFEFLGFSNSSLRAQSVWFMCPVQLGGRVLNARAVVADLGDFSQFRCPAKCAARIGQAFTDTTGVIHLPAGITTVVDDVQRSGRCFSDGVGTISSSILDLIWSGHPTSGHLLPTLYQIRAAGAKGMVSLDCRLEGHAVKLRPSMIKFEGSPITEIEVCGASTRPLPMYLNRQYVSIFEALGVPVQAFLDLQFEAVTKLRRVTANPINAASFLERERVCLPSGMPSFIRNLNYVGIDYHIDIFLRGIVELAALVRLRDIKHRARIPVDEATLLYGIMDETDTLKEGEVFCCKGGRIITGRVMVTRAPALHPGDAQMVTAVTVPDSSPLAALDNCIVFSQRGDRDLPSQLSGGDLDGDQYSVIWDPRLLLPRTVEPADYPRVSPVDIGRAVTVTDMTDFFLDFLENDQLGRIATLHVQLADRYGVEHSDCIKLAEMHSTAVDFSKTGVPV